MERTTMGKDKRLNDWELDSEERKRIKGKRNSRRDKRRQKREGFA